MEKLVLPIFLIFCGMVSLVIALFGIMGSFGVYVLLFGTVLIIAGFHLWKKRLIPSS